MIIGPKANLLATSDDRVIVAVKRVKVDYQRKELVYSDTESWIEINPRTDETRA